MSQLEKAVYSIILLRFHHMALHSEKNKVTENNRLGDACNLDFGSVIFDFGSAILLLIPQYFYTSTVRKEMRGNEIQ
mgnify:CR=1 FL=1